MVKKKRGQRGGGKREEGKKLKGEREEEMILRGREREREREREGGREKRESKKKIRKKCCQSLLIFFFTPLLTHTLSKPESLQGEQREPFHRPRIVFAIANTRTESPCRHRAFLSPKATHSDTLQKMHKQ